MNPDDINELELLGHNVWVAQERMRLGGWLLRADNGIMIVLSKAQRS